MKRAISKMSTTVLTVVLLSVPTATLNAAGPVHCDSGNPANWLSVLQMTERLTAEGWAIDGMVKANGCWKITGDNPEGNRATGYFHPLSGKKLLVKSAGRVLYRSDF